MESAFSPIEMVVSANNLATDAGKRILAMGGTVVDAMIAVQTVLGLVEPQSSGIAGGAFCVLYYNGTLTTYDAREKAPSGATETRFQDEDGNSLDFLDMWQSALSVGVPGVPRLMEDLHQMYGSVSWAELFVDAILLATNGYEQTGRTVEDANELFAENPSCDERLFFRDNVTFDYFFDTESCTPKPEGTLMTNPEYAETLDAIIKGGANAFYAGEIAQAIIDKVNADRNPTGDALITLEDLANYEIVERPPVCKMYRGSYNVCGMGPPSSGALAIGQILGILDNFDLSDTGDRQSVETVHLFTQAMRLAFADRDQYVGDMDFITVPIE
jgi:gamma-glutamyltranspeptidase/glutathione hydrolase